MAAYGPHSHQNDLAKEFMGTLFETHIVPEILKPFVFDTYPKVKSTLRHERAYAYDRFRIAVETAFILCEAGLHSLSKGHWAIVSDKLYAISTDTDWFASWGGDYDSVKGRNYAVSLDEQLRRARRLHATAHE